MTDNLTPLFQSDPLSDLNKLIAMARGRGAAKLLILAGKYPVCRVESKLSPPLLPRILHFSETEALVKSLLNPEQTLELDNKGETEIDYSDGNGDMRINIFFGDGAHNLVVFL